MADFELKEGEEMKELARLLNRLIKSLRRVGLTDEQIARVIEEITEK